MRTEIKDFINDLSHDRVNNQDLEKFIYSIVDKTQKTMINRLKIYGKVEDKVLNQLCKQIK